MCKIMWIREKRSVSDGFALPIALFFLGITILWGNLTLIDVSDQYEIGDWAIQREQSRWLAYSGWNLALQQLEMSGTIHTTTYSTEAGDITIVCTQKENRQMQISSMGKASSARKLVQGTVQLQSFPNWIPWKTWNQEKQPVTGQEETLLWITEETYALVGNEISSLAIGSAYGQPLCVSVSQPLHVKRLYIDGDLNISAPLIAEKIVVSGTIQGKTYLECPEIKEQDVAKIEYQTNVIARVL